MIEEIKQSIASKYASIDRVRSVSVYPHPQSHTMLVMVDAGMGTGYDSELMDRLLDIEYAVHKEIERSFVEAWTLDVSYV